MSEDNIRPEGANSSKDQLARREKFNTRPVGQSYDSFIEEERKARALILGDSIKDKEAEQVRKDSLELGGGGIVRRSVRHSVLRGDLTNVPKVNQINSLKY